MTNVRDLQGAKVTRRLIESDDLKVLQAGRTLEEARKLVEQSFGNYVSSNVMLAAKEELTKVEQEIQALSSEVTGDAIDRKSQKMLSAMAYNEIANLQEELRVFHCLFPTFIHLSFVGMVVNLLLLICYVLNFEYCILVKLPFIMVIFCLVCLYIYDFLQNHNRLAAWDVAWFSEIKN